MIYDLKKKNSYLNIYIDKLMKEALQNSSKPMFLIGNGVRLANGINIFYSLLEKFKIPVLTTWKAADIIP